MGNVRYPQYRTRKRKEQDQVNGFQLGVLACAAMFLDKYEVAKEDAEDLINEAHEFIADFGRGKLDINYVFKELEKRTGINLQEALTEEW